LNDIGEEGKAAWGNKVITNGFIALELILEKTAGKYCVGKSDKF
jgi:maleylacetoacetate isomerase